jgi:hypothetical protein
MDSFTIGFLADYPAALPVLGAAFRADSPEYFRDHADDDIVDQLLRPTLQRDAMPLALVAHVGGAIAGTAALRLDSITTHPHLGPWLAAQSDRTRPGSCRALRRIATSARQLSRPDRDVPILSRPPAFSAPRCWMAS